MDSRNAVAPGAFAVFATGLGAGLGLIHFLDTVYAPIRRILVETCLSDGLAAVGAAFVPEASLALGVLGAAAIVITARVRPASAWRVTKVLLWVAALDAFLAFGTVILTLATGERVAGFAGDISLHEGIPEKIEEEAFASLRRDIRSVRALALPDGSKRRYFWIGGGARPYDPADPKCVLLPWGRRESNADARDEARIVAPWPPGVARTPGALVGLEAVYEFPPVAISRTGMHLEDVHEGYVAQGEWRWVLTLERTELDRNGPFRDDLIAAHVLVYEKLDPGATEPPEPVATYTALLTPSPVSR